MNCNRSIVAAFATLLLVSIPKASDAAVLNRVQKENAQPGTSAWQLTNPADNHRQIEGYASLTSVPVGGDIKLFVNTADPTYSLTVYRMGWDGGKGARRVLGPQTLKGVRQVTPTVDPTVDLIECNWTNPFTIHVPTSWLSGIYLAKLHGNTSGKESYITFTVRDSRPADLVFQQSVTSYEAYNPWPGLDPATGQRTGQSLYRFGTKPDANGDEVQVRAVSFDRPYTSDVYIAVPYPANYGIGAGDFLYNLGPVAMEYSMVRWLEKQGYDVTYITDVDTHEDVHRLLRAKGFLSVGHDEYWSDTMKANAVYARDHGVGLGFFGGNYMYWPIDLRPDANGSPNRTIRLEPKANQCSVGKNACDSNADCGAGETCDIKKCDYACNGETEQAIVGGMDEPGALLPSLISGDDIVVPADAPLDHWVFAGTGLKVNDAIPGLIGIEYNSTITPDDWLFPSDPHPDYPLPPDGWQSLLHTPAPNFGLPAFDLGDDFDGKNFDAWYDRFREFVVGGGQLDATCDDTTGVPPLFIAVPGICRNPWPYWSYGPLVREDWRMTIYQAVSGAWVFNAATNQWSWGLDDYYTGLKTADGADNGPALRTQCGQAVFHPGLVSCRNAAAEQITRNVLNRFITGH